MNKPTTNCQESCMTTYASADEEIATRDRFAFGDNWTSFLEVIDDERIHQAMLSIQTVLKGKELVGRRFLDVGSGSGLASLAARKLGMQVASFDCDSVSVACTNRLKEAYCAGDPAWLVYQGSVLDTAFLAHLGAFDVVHAWGVLHHTNDMWAALENVLGVVSDRGSVIVALYNDQGVWSKVWKTIKAIYNKLPRLLRPLFVILIMVPCELRSVAVPLLKGKFKFVLQRWTRYGLDDGGRGMSRWHDMVDWVGGYPFEVSKPEDVFYFVTKRGFLLVELKTCAGELGCNEYVFEKK